MAKKEDNHKGTFVGVHLSDEQVEKVEKIAQAFNDTFGDVGRNRARALRWLIDCFDESWLENFPAKPVMQTKRQEQPAPAQPGQSVAAKLRAKDRAELPTPTPEQTTDEAERRALLAEQMRQVAERRASGKNPPDAPKQ